MAQQGRQKYSNNRTAKIMHKRELEFVNDNRLIEKPHLIMRVMSYNVLADHLLWEHPKLYSKCHERHKDFQDRSRRIIQTITRQDPTIVCLQEVDAKHFDTLYKSKLYMYGYEGEFFKRTGLDKQDRAAIFYKKKWFKLIECSKKPYLVPGHRVLDRDNVGLGTRIRMFLILGLDKQDGAAIFYKKKWFKLIECSKKPYLVPGHRVLDRDNVGIVMALEPVEYKARKLPARVCVANTHLLFNERRGDVKLAQLSYLLAELDRMAQKPGKPSGTYYPSFLCGDLNAVPMSPLIKFIVGGSINYKNVQGKLISGQNMSGREGPYIDGNILPPFIKDTCQYKNLDEPAKPLSHGADVCDPATRTSSNTPPGSTLPGSTPPDKKMKLKSPGKINHQYAFPTSGDEQNCADSDKVEEAGQTSGDSTENETHSLTVSDILNNLQGTNQPSSDSSKPRKQRKKKKQPTPTSTELWGDLTHGFNFISAYDHYKIDRLLPEHHREITTKHMDNNGLNVDYIFSTVKSKILSEDAHRVTDVTNDHLTLLSRYGLLSQDELENADTLPNGIEPSDHLPIVAEYALHN